MHPQRQAARSLLLLCLAVLACEGTRPNTGESSAGGRSSSLDPRSFGVGPLRSDLASFAGTGGLENGPDRGSPRWGSSEFDAPSGGDGAGGGGLVSRPFLLSFYCGDGIRDNTLASVEECDDGEGAESDLCTDRCQVSDALAARGPAQGQSRYLGEGRHPVSASEHGFGVVFVEPDAEPAVVGLSVFDAAGDPRARIDASAGGSPIWLANPVTAALADGSYAVVWTDLGGDGDELGIALRRVMPQTTPGTTPPQAGAELGAVLSPIQSASAAGDFAQYDADVVASGNTIVVAWTDTADLETAPDIRYQTFGLMAGTEGFIATGTERTLAATSAFEGNVALAAVGTEWIAAWRSSAGDGFETVEVAGAGAGETRWTIGPHLAGPEEDHPAIVDIGGGRIAIVYTVGTDPENSGIAAVPRVRAAVIDLATTGAPQPVELPPAAPDYDDPLVGQSHPNAVRAGEVVYVAWRSEARPGEAEAENVWLRAFDAASGVLVPLGIERQVPRWPGAASYDQSFPALAVGPRRIWTEALPEPSPEGALVVAWDDYGVQLGIDQGQPDVLVQHWPLPVVRFDEPRRSDCSSVDPCGPGEGHCDDDAECESGLTCLAGQGPQYGLAPGVSVCVPEHCADGIANADETGVDCGGADCGQCLCGDGIVLAAAGEECDDAGESAACNADCTLALCGDGKPNTAAGEECDDGNAVDTDACLAICEAAYCGDGIVWAGVETCDDAGPSATCTATCSTAISCNNLLDSGCPSGQYCENGLCAPRPCSPNDPFVSITPVFGTTSAVDGFTLSNDQLTAYVSRGAPFDIYATTRPSVGATFGPLTPLAGVNSVKDERTPWLSPDGLKLYFSTTNTANNLPDIVFSSRPDTSAAFGAPQVVPGVNLGNVDQDPYFSLGEQILYFTSHRNGDRDVYISTVSNGIFGTPQLLPVVFSGFQENHPVVSRNGLTLYFNSRRDGYEGDLDGDIWLAERAATSVNFNEPANLSVLNTNGNEFPVALSPDACTLYLSSNRHTAIGNSPVLRLYAAKRGPAPSQVTVALNLVGSGSIATAPYNCTTGNTGTCSAAMPYGTAVTLFASRPAYWSGACGGALGGTLGDDGTLRFTIDPVCQVVFPCDSNAECGSGTVCSDDAGLQYELPTGTGVCVPSHCTDGLLNGDETAVDCGGSACGRCLCGDGVLLTAAGEQCDDGNASDADACPTTCQNAICGDGFVRTGVEECDDGASTATCSSDCRLRECGYASNDPACAAGQFCDDDGLCKPQPCNINDPFVSLTSVFPSTVFAEGITFSQDDLTAYVSVGTGSTYDLQVATRASTTAAFGTLTPVAGITNVPERAPFLSQDGLRLYFWAGAANGHPDLMYSSRLGLGTPFAAAVALTAVNSTVLDQDPFFTQGGQALFFDSKRDTADQELFFSTWSAGAFTTPQRLPATLNSTADDERPVLSRDGLRLYFRSKRQGIFGDTDGDIWISERATTSADFGAPTNLSVLNSHGNEFPVALSADGCSLYIASNRNTGLGGTDTFRLYEAKRGPQPSLVTITLNVVGGAGSVGSPFNCSTGNIGTCTAQAPYGTQVVWASSPAYWEGGCAANGSPGLSTDAVMSFTVDPICKVTFP